MLLPYILLGIFLGHDAVLMNDISKIKDIDFICVVDVSGSMKG